MPISWDGRDEALSLLGSMAKLSTTASQLDNLLFFKDELMSWCEYFGKM
jgi:hypothetical protein